MDLMVTILYLNYLRILYARKKFIDQKSEKFHQKVLFVNSHIVIKMIGNADDFIWKVLLHEKLENFTSNYHVYWFSTLLPHHF